MSVNVKRNATGRYYAVGKQYSIETYATIFQVAIKYKKLTGRLPLPYQLSKMTCVSFKVAKKAIVYMQGGVDVLHRPSGHGYSGTGSIKLTKADQLFLLGLYHKDPSRPLYSYATELQDFSGTKVCVSTLCKWFSSSFKFKGKCRKPSIFPEQKFSSENIKKLEDYVNIVSYFEHRRFVFTDEKPMKGIDIYNKKVRRSPLDGSVPLVDTGFDIINVYNLMAAIKLDYENPIANRKNVAYQLGKYRGTSTAFNFFITELVATGFLKSGDVLICDNASIHKTSENRNLADILWDEKQILILFLPPYCPELNPIELVFQLLGHRLRNSNARHLGHQMKSSDFFLQACVSVLHSISHVDIMKMYKKCGYIV